MRSRTSEQPKNVHICHFHVSHEASGYGLNPVWSFTLQSQSRRNAFFFPYLMICPPVTLSNMSHSVRKIPLTPFSWTDASDTGYWYQISSCQQKQEDVFPFRLCVENY